jgi:hypothetical protein
MKAIISASWLAVLLVAVPAELYGDPIRVGGSVVFLESSGTSHVVLVGVGFQVTLPADPGHSEARNACQPCFPGDELSFASSLPLLGSGFQGHGTFGSETLSVYALGSLSFAGDDAIVPPIVHPFFATIRQPFTFAGEAQFSNRDTHAVLFNESLTGTGTATLFLRREGDGYQFNQIHYDLDTVVPEPATVSLIGTGMAWLGVRAVRRRRNSPA